MPFEAEETFWVITPRIIVVSGRNQGQWIQEGELYLLVCFSFLFSLIKYFFKGPTVFYDYNSPVRELDI